eukprot:CAMPEP_0117423356 /NCGR_PEP_ID=MMETSP0758-20121206/3996_1 /TAXON_ID=63605 /ORGANISM="Percolomonas cosmopolitus, Strain AE-1 (ATCC 50343)" /LENGTH=792 /DNA_ID=CAMNT_0005206495 /DNA_START=20 /DNA_END=2398 /DNA_ORIENTATION=-
MIKNFLRAKLGRKKKKKIEVTISQPSEVTLIETMEKKKIKKPRMSISTGKNANVVNNNYILSAKDSPKLNTRLKEIMSPNSPQFKELKEGLKRTLKQISPGSPGNNFNPFASSFKTSPPKEKEKRKKSPLSPPKNEEEQSIDNKINESPRAKKVSIMIPKEEKLVKTPIVPPIKLERTKSCIQLREDQKKPPQANSLTPRTPRRRSRRSKRASLVPPPPRPTTPVEEIAAERRKSMGLKALDPEEMKSPTLSEQEQARKKITQSLTSFGLSLPMFSSMPNMIMNTPKGFNSSFDIEDEIIKDQHVYGSLSSKTMSDSPEADHPLPFFPTSPSKKRSALPFISFRMKKITEELLKTEHYYVDSLQTLYHRYMIPSKALLSDQSYTKIFHNVHTIVTINRALLMRWLKCLRGENTNSKTSHFFMDEPEFNPLVEHISRQNFTNFIYEIQQSLDSLRYYAPYGTSYSTTCDCLREELSNNRGFKSFVETQTLKIKAEGARCYGLNSLLILPIQRIPRYRLMFTDMLNELEKHAHRIRDDYVDLTMTMDLEKERDERLNYINKLIHVLRVTTSKLNEIMFKFDDSVDLNNRRMQVVDIADALGIPELIEPQRSFLTQIPVTLIRERTSMDTQTLPETKSSLQNSPPPLLRVRSAGAALRVSPSTTTEVPHERAQSIDDATFDLSLEDLKNRKSDQFTLYVFNDMILCYRLKRFLFFKQRQCIPIRVSSMNHHVSMILKENEDQGGNPIIQFLISSNEDTSVDSATASITFTCSPLDAVNLRSVLKRHFKDSCTLVI